MIDECLQATIFAYPHPVACMPHFPHAVPSKLPQVGTTIFTVMSALANAHDAVNLSQGFPDFPVPEKLVKSVAKHMKKGHNQYAPMAGVLPLREAVVAQFEDRYNAKYDPNSEVTITAGATQALFTAITALVKEGDEVLLFTPAYDCYAPAVELAGGSPVYIQLHAPDYQIDWAEVRRRVNRKTRMIVLNTPHNPTGTVLSPQDLKELERIVKDLEVLVLSDEVYEYMVFDGKQHQSMARSEVLQNRSLIVGSFGKTYHATGWKTGYIIGPENLMAEFRKVHQYNVFCHNTPVQYGLADFMGSSDHHMELASFYQERRDVFLEGLKGTRFTTQPSGGTYFQLLSYANIEEAPDVEVARRWTVEHGVASIPVSVFYHQPVNEHMLRFCFAKSNDTLERGLERLRAIG